MKTNKEALKEQEAEMLKQFDVKELEERLEMAEAAKPGWLASGPGGPSTPFPPF